LEGRTRNFSEIGLETVHFSLFSVGGSVLSGAWRIYFWCDSGAVLVRAGGVFNSGEQKVKKK
jgi:hypothetical protein